MHRSKLSSTFAAFGVVEDHRLECALAVLARERRIGEDKTELSERDLLLKESTLVDATNIHAPTSTKKGAKAR